MFVEGGDGRSAWSRRWADLVCVHVTDLGGPEVLSEAQISICRRASAMECTLEQMEARMSAGEPVDSDQYGRLAGRLCRLFEMIGVTRVARPVDDPMHALAKSLEAYAPAPIEDDEDDGGDNARLPIEELVEPTTGSSGQD